MYDLEKMDVMLGNYSRNVIDSQRETVGDLESNGLQTVNHTSENFRSQQYLTQIAERTVKLPSRPQRLLKMKSLQKVLEN